MRRLSHSFTPTRPPAHAYLPRRGAQGVHMVEHAGVFCADQDHPPVDFDAVFALQCVGGQAVVHPHLVEAVHVG